MEMFRNNDIDSMVQAFSAAKVIYANIRMLIRYNPLVRATLNLDTKDGGIYITDIMKARIENMIEYCNTEGYTLRRVVITCYEVERFGMLLRDVLQYFHYFIRPDFRQKPDIEIATEKYKEIADKHTVEELRKIVGRNSIIDFESLGSTRLGTEDIVEAEKHIGYRKEESYVDEDTDPDEEMLEEDLDPGYDKNEGYLGPKKNVPADVRNMFTGDDKIVLRSGAASVDVKQFAKRR